MSGSTDSFIGGGGGCDQVVFLQAKKVQKGEQTYNASQSQPGRLMRHAPAALLLGK
jgi:hypothetical protein